MNEMKQKDDIIATQEKMINMGNICLAQNKCREQSEQIKSLQSEIEKLKSKWVSVEEVREKIADCVGYDELEGGCDEGQRSYGTNDDNLIYLAYQIITTGKCDLDSLP